MSFTDSIRTTPETQSKATEAKATRVFTYTAGDTRGSAAGACNDIRAWHVLPVETYDQLRELGYNEKYCTGKAKKVTEWSFIRVVMFAVNMSRLLSYKNGLFHIVCHPR